MQPFFQGRPFLALICAREKSRTPPMNPFFSPRPKKRDQIVAIDLGAHTTKAILLQRKEEHFTLARYAIQETPVQEKGLSPAVLGEHLKRLVQSLETKVQKVTVAIGPRDTILRNVELPLLPVSEMRQMLKVNSKSYLQQDLPDYVFDCFFVPPRKLPEMAKATPQTKYKVWVGGMKRQLLDELEAAIKAAGLVPEQIVLGLLGPTNAFELTPPVKDSVALVDLGFRSSTISILSAGELCLSRVVEIGGDHITQALVDSMGITYAEAEGIKIGMPAEVDAPLMAALTPLGRDLRASIDFFEHHQDLPVGQVFVSGGAARSEYFIQALQTELMIPCKIWNPLVGLELALPPLQAEQLPQYLTQLPVAVGAASTLF